MVSIIWHKHKNRIIIFPVLTTTSVVLLLPILMEKANEASLPSGPLYEKIPLKYYTHRVLDIVVTLLLASLLVYRLLHLKSHGFPWLVALLCESWFTFLWLLTISIKWTPAFFRSYPERLPSRVEEKELPPVDMFVTTADPVLEPPIITVNTVISLMAVDYPSNKLACYVSDDGCSPLTYYSLVETSKFAKLWVPFCKKYNIQVRAPFRYFSGSGSDESLNPADRSPEFWQEHETMKEAYGLLTRKIEEAAVSDQSTWDGISSGDLDAFANVDRTNHPTIIKVICLLAQLLSFRLPHLVYISREKRPKYPHHYKAGAMNVLTRVSGLMTNAPYMMNVDCDMYANNPLIVRHAMCMLLGASNERETGFVQFPQCFYGALKDDPFGNQLIVLYQFIGSGIAGIQGPLYGGTGCFHRRKVIYGLCPDDFRKQGRIISPVHENLSEKELLKTFGYSKELAKSAALALKGHNNNQSNTFKSSLSDLMEAANQVSGCDYESSTNWGKAYVGWQYGSATEDVLTGLTIHARGWKSVTCIPTPLAFLGCAPTGGPSSLTQQKRWATGLLEILITNRSPLISVITAELLFRQCLGYVWISIWALRSIPELCYSFLPAYCLLTKSNFLPKVQDPGFYIITALLAVYTLYTLMEYFQMGLSIRAWWNNQKMSRIVITGPRLFSVLSVLCKILGISETVFEVTQKDSTDQSGDEDASRFTFDESPIFVPGTTLVLVSLAALGAGLLGSGGGLGEIVGCVVILCFFRSFVEGLFRKGKYGIPLTTFGKSVALALVFVLSLKPL
ncbi:Cellulose synthase-like protein B3 [Linum grandiflorum]